MNEYNWLVEYLLYLRKSRADNPNETVEEVLSKHETILQEFCEREFGYRIPEENIYREVVSGESIQDRIEIKKVLSRLESPKIKGVIVVDPQRLSRGDLLDCGHLINHLQYSNSLVVTPMMSYDMNNKMEKRFFQDELMRGRDYLEYIKETLYRGRVAAAKRGCFASSFAPFGYNKVRIGKDWTLEPNDKAEYVRLIFDMYVNQWKTPYEIANELRKLGIKSSRGVEWNRDTVRKVLRNVHYTGKILFLRHKDVNYIEDGKIVKKRITQDIDDCILVEGKHPAIISQEMFDKAQARFKSNPPVKENKQLRNVFAGVIFCGYCKRALSYNHSQGNQIVYRCNNNNCCKIIAVDKVNDTIINILETVELPKLEIKYKNGDGNSTAIQKSILAKLEKQLEDYKVQEETQYELLETKQYTQELFNKRNGMLREKMANCEEQIKEVKSKLPDSVDYEERIETLKSAIASLKDDRIPVKAKNELLKTIIDRIEYTSPKHQGRGKNNFNLSITLKL